MTPRRAALLAGVLALAPGPALACTPIMSVAFPWVMLAWLLWVVLWTGAAALRPEMARHVSRVWFVVPLGFMAFAVPMLGILVLPAALLMVAFPMYLAVEALSALFGRAWTGHRGAALLCFGLPAAVVLAGGIFSKVLLYGEYSGFRDFAWNTVGQPGVGFLLFWLGIGAVVVFQHLARRQAEA